ncbi:MAG: acyltransferase [Candidatus Binatia bacterium]
MRYDIRTYLRVGCFQTVWGIVKYLPSPAGDLLRFLTLKLFMKKISTMWIRPGVTIWWPERISIGASSLNEDIHLNGFGGITIGDRVLIGHRCTFFSDEHGFEDPDQLIWFQERRPARIRVEDDVYFGCNVVVLAGVTVGQGAVIGAGSVVNADVPPFAIAAGAPVRVMRYRGDRLNGQKNGNLQAESRHG